MRRPNRALAPFIAAVIGTASALVGADPGRAGTVSIEVTTTDDELNTDGDCSLREAVIAANTNALVDACPAGNPGIDEIMLQPATYVLAIAGANEDLALTGDLDLRDDVAIRVGEIGQTATIDADGLDRIFDVADGVRQASLNSLTLRNGNAGDREGGAIRMGQACDIQVRNDSLENLIVEGNRAAVGGGISIGSCRNPWFRFNSIVNNHAETFGGGLSVTGTTLLRIENSTITGNRAGIAGGGVWSELVGVELVVLYATIAHNAAPDGAGIWVGGDERGRRPIVDAAVIAENDGPDCGGGSLAGSGWVTDDASCDFPWYPDVGIGPRTVVGHNVVHLLEPGSPAIDFHQDPNCTSWLSGDQIGTARGVDGNGDGSAWCDAGAIEAPAVPFVSPSPTPTGPPASAGPPAPLPDTAMFGGTPSLRLSLWDGLG